MTTKFDRYLAKRGLDWNQYRSKDEVDRAFLRLQFKESIGQSPDVHDLKILGISTDETIPKDTKELERRSLESKKLEAEKEKQARWEALMKKTGYKRNTKGMQIFNTSHRNKTIPTNESLYH